MKIVGAILALIVLLIVGDIVVHILLGLFIPLVLIAGGGAVVYHLGKGKGRSESKLSSGSDKLLD